MEYVLYKSIFFLIGLMIIVIGRYLPSKFLMPNPAKYKIIDVTKYIKHIRIAFYILGLFCISFGILLLFVSLKSIVIFILTAFF